MGIYRRVYAAGANGPLRGCEMQFIYRDFRNFRALNAGGGILGFFLAPECGLMGRETRALLAWKKYIGKPNFSTCAVTAGVYGILEGLEGKLYELVLWKWNFITTFIFENRYFIFLENIVKL